MSKISNDENIKNLRKRKILRVIVIVLAIITIILSLASFFFKINIIFPLIFFVITHFLLKYREKIKINKKDDLDSVKKIINKNKKK